MPQVLGTGPHVKGANSESRQQLEECGKILEKETRSSGLASPDGQLHIATFLLVFPAPQ